MPNVNGKPLSPDEAMLLGLCPECGAAVIPRVARAHAESHWSADPDATRLSAEGRRRFKLLLDFAYNRFIGPVSGTSPPATAPPIRKPSETPYQDDEREHHWWQLQNRSMLWGAIPVATFVFGLELFRDKDWIWGAIFTGASILALLWVDRLMRITSEQMVRTPSSGTSKSQMIIIALLALLTWGGVIYDIYYRDFAHHQAVETHIPGRLTDTEKWLLGNKMRDFNEYLLTVIYYPDRAKVAEEIVDVIKAGAIHVSSELATTELPDGITVCGRVSNPHVQQLADVLSDAYDQKVGIGDCGKASIDNRLDDSLTIRLGAP
ncbi:MAG TPA: hypothetical protein VND20_08075 [Candidatus Binataceae bacterium]|nr:hypothetical protein [Candidatus Binataceae bacterium]